MQMARQTTTGNNFYRSELSSLPAERGLYYDSKGAWLRCPKHNNGQERSPSLKVTVDDGKYQGSFYCFGCHAGGGWNKLAKDYFPQLKKISGGAKSANASFSFKKFEAVEQVPDFSNMIPWAPTVDWRGIRGETLVRFGTKVVSNRNNVELIIPVTVLDEPRGYIRAKQEPPRRLANGKKEHAYFNMPGEWVKESLLGYDLARRKARRLRKRGKLVALWVVEGPRDTMNVEQLGGIVVGLIGSNITKAKLMLMLQIDPDVIVVATDNDDAGNNAAAHLLHGKIGDDGKKEFDGLGDMLPCVRVKFKDGRDPADLDLAGRKRIDRRAKQRI